MARNKKGLTYKCKGFLHLFKIIAYKFVEINVYTIFAHLNYLAKTKQQKTKVYSRSDDLQVVEKKTKCAFSLLIKTDGVAL